MAPFLGARKYSDAIRLLYRGTLRVLLILLHDFPEFLCCYHFGFMDVLPLQCIQLRNLVLSAFPKVMKLPDPFTMNLAASALLPEMQQNPQILSDFTSTLALGNLKGDLDLYLKNRGPPTFLASLRARVSVPRSANGLNYSVQMINSLVFHVGLHAISLQTNPMQITSNAATDIFQTLASDMDTEGISLCFNVRTIFLPLRDCKSLAIPKQPYLLLQQHNAPPIRRSETRDRAGTSHEGVVGKIDCESPASAWIACHVYRIDQESDV
jgi:CCR4-NOT transcription complex subunit 1